MILNKQYSELTTSQERIEFRTEIVKMSNNDTRNFYLKEQSTASAARLIESLESILSQEINDATRKVHAKLLTDLNKAQEKKQQDVPVNYNVLLSSINGTYTLDNRRGEPYFILHCPQHFYNIICLEFETCVYSDEETRLFGNDGLTIILSKVEVAGNEEFYSQRINAAILQNKENLLEQIRAIIRFQQARCSSDEARAQNTALQEVSEQAEAIITKINLLNENNNAQPSQITSLSEEGEVYTRKVNQAIRNYKTNTQATLLTQYGLHHHRPTAVEADPSNDSNIKPTTKTI